jgi:hypothetical protein
MGKVILENERKIIKKDIKLLSYLNKLFKVTNNKMIGGNGFNESKFDNIKYNKIIDFEENNVVV